MLKHIAVIGAGAAGLIAAGRAAEKGNKVTIFERNERIGKKLSITGKGRCNITNVSDIEDLIINTPGNGSFLYSAFYNFSNKDIINFFNTLGVKTKIERGKRVFPESDKASDVVKALKKYTKKNGVSVRYNSRVKEIIAECGSISALRLYNGEIFPCDGVILATGGMSYPRTGSTGDGYIMAKKLGHSIVSPRASLVPLKTEGSVAAKLQGLTLKNVEIVLKKKNSKKEIYRKFGEMLFTHDGVSGPIVLSASRHLLNEGFDDIDLIIDLKPALSFEVLDKRIQRDFEKYSKKQYKNSLSDLLPKKLIPVIIELSGIDGKKIVNQISKQERMRLVRLLKNFKFKISGTYPISDAIVTAGGVSVKEIEPYTLKSKIIKGLSFAGEVIDVDAYTGGYNLTIAFSTGYLAGDSV